MILHHVFELNINSWLDFKKKKFLHLKMLIYNIKWLQNIYISTTTYKYWLKSQKQKVHARRISKIHTKDRMGIKKKDKIGNGKKYIYRKKIFLGLFFKNNSYLRSKWALSNMVHKSLIDHIQVVFFFQQLLMEIWYVIFFSFSKQTNDKFRMNEWNIFFSFFLKKRHKSKW